MWLFTKTTKPLVSPINIVENEARNVLFCVRGELWGACDELQRLTVNSSILHILKKGTFSSNTRHPKDPRYIPIPLYITQKSFPQQNCRANKLRTYVRLFPGKIMTWLKYCTSIPPKHYRSKSAKKRSYFPSKNGYSAQVPVQEKKSIHYRRISPSSFPFRKKTPRDDFSGERNEDWCVYFLGIGVTCGTAVPFNTMRKVRRRATLKN